jgi:hypothetical protein
MRSVVSNQCVQLQLNMLSQPKTRPCSPSRTWLILKKQKIWNTKPVLTEYLWACSNAPQIYMFVWILGNKKNRKLLFLEAETAERPSALTKELYECIGISPADLADLRRPKNEICAICVICGELNLLFNLFLQQRILQHFFHF